MNLYDCYVNTLNNPAYRQDPALASAARQVAHEIWADLSSVLEVFDEYSRFRRNPERDVLEDFRSFLGDALLFLKRLGNERTVADVYRVYNQEQEQFNALVQLMETLLARELYEILERRRQENAKNYVVVQTTAASSSAPAPTATTTAATPAPAAASQAGKARCGGSYYY